MAPAKGQQHGCNGKPQLRAGFVVFVPCNLQCQRVHTLSCHITEAPAPASGSSGFKYTAIAICLGCGRVVAMTPAASAAAAHALSLCTPPPPPRAVWVWCADRELCRGQYRECWLKHQVGEAPSGRPLTECDTL